MDIGKMSLGSLRKTIERNRDAIVKTNVIGSDFSFVEGNRKAIFKIDPMGYYHNITPEDNAFLSFVFSHNDFVTSGTEPDYALIDFESPIGLNEEYDRFMDEMFSILRKRRILLASAHTGSYGNLAHGIAGSIALVGFSRPLFSFKKIKKSDRFYLIGKLGSEWIYFASKLLSLDVSFDKRNLSISKVMKKLANYEGKVNYVHDLSEGGLMRALREVSSVAGSGFDIRTEELKNSIQGDIIENHIDPLTVSSSGAVVISVSNEFANEFEKSFPMELVEIRKASNGIFVDGKVYRKKRDELQRVVKKLSYI